MVHIPIWIQRVHVSMMIQLGVFPHLIFPHLESAYLLNEDVQKN